MKFFIDTANLEQIREANALGVLDGVTTNPSLMAKEGIKGVENQHKHYIEICNIVDGDVSAEVIATNYEGMIKEGEELAALNPHIVIYVRCFGWRRQELVSCSHKFGTILQFVQPVLHRHCKYHPVCRQTEIHR